MEKSLPELELLVVLLRLPDSNSEELISPLSGSFWSFCQVPDTGLATRDRTEELTNLLGGYPHAGCWLQQNVLKQLSLHPKVEGKTSKRLKLWRVQGRLHRLHGDLGLRGMDRS